MGSPRRRRTLGALLAASTAVAMIAPVAPGLAAASNTWSGNSAPLHAVDLEGLPDECAARLPASAAGPAERPSPTG